MSFRQVLLAPIADKLDDLDREFQEQLRSPIPIIAEITTYIGSQTGKRIRPALLLLSARMLGYQGRGDVVFSAVIEFIHTATLIHDDIIDNASTRRGKPSVNARWGNNLTVLLGDYLYLKSMEFALTQGSLRALEILTGVTITMIEGELLQVDSKRSATVTREAYLDMIYRKTAALFTGCGRIAAHLANADEAKTVALDRFCYNAGMAFQIADDLLDLVGDEKELGKPVLSDLREGRLTLPVIELLAQSESDDRTRILRILETGEATAADHARILSQLRDRGILDATSALAHEYAKEARTQLAIFPDSAAKRVLDLVPDYIVSRTS